MWGERDSARPSDLPYSHRTFLRVSLNRYKEIWKIELSGQFLDSDTVSPERGNGNDKATKSWAGTPRRCRRCVPFERDAPELGESVIPLGTECQPDVL